jgi:hypothetical protein
MNGRLVDVFDGIGIDYLIGGSVKAKDFCPMRDITFVG